MVEVLFVVVVLPKIALFANKFVIFAFVIDEDAAVVVLNVDVALNDAGDAVLKVPDTYRLVAVALVVRRLTEFVVLAFVVDAYTVDA